MSSKLGGILMIIKKVLVCCIIVPLAILEVLTVLNPKKAYVIAKKDYDDEVNETGSGSPMLDRVLGVIGCLMTGILFYWLITM